MTFNQHRPSRPLTFHLYDNTRQPTSVFGFRPFAKAIFCTTKNLNFAQQEIYFTFVSKKNTCSKPAYSSANSAFELETQLTIAHNIGYLETETYQTLIEELTSIQKQTNQLRKKILE